MKAKSLKRLLVIKEICTWLPPGFDKRKICSQLTNVAKVESTGHRGSSGVLIMLVSIVVSDKLSGQKGVTKKKKNMNFWAFLTSFKNNDYLQLFDVYVLILWRTAH